MRSESPLGTSPGNTIRGWTFALLDAQHNPPGQPRRRWTLDDVTLHHDGVTHSKWTWHNTGETWQCRYGETPQPATHQQMELPL